MRGGSRREREQFEWSTHDFAWDRAITATLRHSTLPFADDASLTATPLASFKDAGTRDRLSLLGQFAAHQAFLQFAGVADGELDPNEWVIVRKRGADCRLIRIAARAVAAGDVPPLLTVAQQFAESIGAELDVLRQSWARAEAVYLETYARLRDDVAADLRWLRNAAHGRILAPGPEALRMLLADRKGRFACSDLTALRSLDDVIVLEGAGPWPTYAALQPLGTFRGKEADVAEQILASAAKRVFAVSKLDAFDAPSRQVVDMLLAAGSSAWVLPDGGTPLPATQLFVVAPRLAARRALEERLAGLASREEWLQQFIESPALDAYLDSGALPNDATLPALTEPRRSYISALALLGLRIPAETAKRFLADFLFHQPLEELAIDGITAIEDDHLVFASEETRAQAERLIPPASRSALCRVAAGATSGVRAAMLWIDAGDLPRAAQLFEQVTWSSAPECIATLRAVPRAALSPAVAQTLAHAFLAEGRYRDARELAAVLTGDARELVLAIAERRTGDYAPALTRVERIANRCVTTILLHAELLRLHARDAEADEVLNSCDATSDDDRIRLAYQRSVGSTNHHEAIPDEHYLASRLATYRALRAGEYDVASRHAGDSLQRARNTMERIDAWLDRLFATFSAGRWSDARTIAMEALTEVEETQGDRAAGGILFTLAYLAADDGQWTHAAQRIARLRRFYSGTRDDRRLRELALLAAHLDFARGRFAEAKREAAAVLSGDRDHDQIVEAAALILDEIDRIEGRSTPLRATGTSGNAELTARYVALRDVATEPHDDGTRTAKLKRFRWALAHGRRDVAEPLARELELVLSQPKTAGDGELRILRAAATREFPFVEHDFEEHWCFASRNRLGHWNAIGSQSATGAELDAISVESSPGWITVSDRELLFLEGSETWNEEAREALAAIFRARAENHRLRRLIDQEDAPAATRIDSADGIVGHSPAVREVYALITRIARRDVSVCVLGESGTGKELAARAIHRNSTRRGKTFTAVNCAALPENLIESELFGHVRGAFTGADRDRAGLIESTDGGTLFLDEIGEMPLTAQAKLLRFLQEGEFRRVGDTVNRTADVRIVSATNRKLESAVENGRFREDLYYRIRGVEVALPPLRERATDILLLATHFINAEREKHRGGPARLSEEAESLFLSYSWPGNVRELQNTIRGAHAMAADVKEIDLEHLPERLRQCIPARTLAGSYQDAVARFKRELIERSLLAARGNQNQAAAMLRVSRQALAYQIRELGILVAKPRSA